MEDVQYGIQYGLYVFFWGKTIELFKLLRHMSSWWTYSEGNVSCAGQQIFLRWTERMVDWKIPSVFFRLQSYSPHSFHCAEQIEESGNTRGVSEGAIEFLHCCEDKVTSFDHWGGTGRDLAKILCADIKDMDDCMRLTSLGLRSKQYSRNITGGYLAHVYIYAAGQFVPETICQLIRYACVVCQT